MTPTTQRITTLSACALSIFSAGGIAQPSDPMPGSAERVREAESVLPRGGTNESPVLPTVALVSKSVEPGLTEGHDWAKSLSESLDRRSTPRTLAEGTFLLDRRGELVRGPSDRLIFVPDKQDRRPGEGPMLMLPCSVLDQLAQSWTGQPVLIRGEVFLYHGRNYLLPAWFTMVSDAITSSDPELPTEEAPAPDDQENPAMDADGLEEQPATLEDDPEIRALLQELESEQPTQPSAPGAAHQELTGSTPTAPARASTTASGIREGTILMRRRGRLDRQTDGSWALVFDNDEASELGAEALTILPCRLLMEMESLSARDGGVRELIVSGRVYASEGDGYLLPTLIQRVRPEGITPRQ
ncbi:MAG: hypothetical protein KC996_12100 [Phycisphaerales bacterium]|nr:hypothetical protein [Phycisphaerales bacterium]